MRRASLIVFGEQGIGDELMFGTCFNQAIKEFDVIFECHPRLEIIHRNSTWVKQLASEGRDVKLFPHRKDEHIDWPIKHGIIADYKCPIGDLAARYRPNLASFQESWKQYGPSYSADPIEVDSYRKQLEILAKGRPIVGLATRGGVMQTARQYRTLKIPDADYLFENTDCLFIGLDYDDMTGFAIYLDDKYGEGRYRWLPSIVQHWDYAHTAALIAACDMVVTVCQSVAHLSAGMGINTRVLTPARCAWRYARMPDTELWNWYPDNQVKLYRQDDPMSWKGPLDRVITDIKGLKQ